MHILYYIAVILFSGILMARIVSKFKLPNVTGYLLAGVIIGPSVLGLVPENVTSSLSVISVAALGFIAYSIGSELNIEHLKKSGSSIIWITLLEAVGAVIIVDLAMIFIFRQPVAFSLVLGAIAAATAPAATIMVIRQYKAKGPLVSTLLPVVAMDDAVAIIVFGISTAVAHAITSTDQNITIWVSILSPIREILLALLIGFLVGLGLAYFSRKAKGEEELLSFTIAAIFLTVGLSYFFNVSTLLACMMVGATVSNMAYNKNRLFSVMDRFTPPIFIAFFTLAGAELKIEILRQVGLVGVGYIVFRVIGKMLGAYLGAKLTDAPLVIQKYLGLALIPQAGVAIGLSMIAEQILPGMGVVIRTIILSATVVYELIGPVAAKVALFKAGEINVKK
jgi:Kef-type K+ transport system membrane component KefB